MNAHSNKFFEAAKCDLNDGHYKTFLEQISTSANPLPDSGLPSQMNSELGRCDICPSWSFGSKTERCRHYITRTINLHQS